MKDIYIDDIGNGVPFVMVHGFLGSSEMWTLQKQFFKRDYRVITPALPGFGESSKIQSKDSIIKMAKLITKQLKKKNIYKYNLMGHSMGGMIAQEIAKIEGDKIAKLICYGTGSIGDIPGRFETIDASRDKLKKSGIKLMANRIAKTWFIEGEKAKYFYICDNANKVVSEETADNALIAMKNWRGLENLKNIKSKTLIIWGDQDKAYNFEQVKTLHQNIPNSELAIIKDCSHNVHLEKPMNFNRIIKNFLD
jgi:pimeloyl-ACP methyl ester carboxylesterase|tara:strand:- start:387 stop:1139 length:753 start_codon:yes stop_codon:yes gene_type:complete